MDPVVLSERPQSQLERQPVPHHHIQHSGGLLGLVQPHRTSFKTQRGLRLQSFQSKEQQLVLERQCFNTVVFVAGGHQAHVGRREEPTWWPVAHQLGQKAENVLVRQLLAGGHALSYRRELRRPQSICKSY